MKKFKIEAKNKKADIWIYEDIGDSWFGGLSAKRFAEELKGAGKISEITVHLNSAGGDVFDGVAIYNQLKKHPATVSVEIDGLAASIASLIAMSGDTVYMAENALMMIHDPWGGISGTASEMRDFAEKLDKVKSVLVDTYVARSGQDADDISALMTAETWFTASEAADLGFVDEITAEQKMAAHFDLSRFKNAPKDLPGAVYTVKPAATFERRNKYKAEAIRERILLK
jgi:ATP-dependent Clp endopeptidase proteolytic subunit ClpP